MVEYFRYNSSDIILLFYRLNRKIQVYPNANSDWSGGFVDFSLSTCWFYAFAWILFANTWYWTNKSVFLCLIYSEEIIVISWNIPEKNLLSADFFERLFYPFRFAKKSNGFIQKSAYIFSLKFHYSIIRDKWFSIDVN